jgi:hypothetical protein
VRFIRTPPLSPAVLPTYRVFFAAAVASLPKRYRRMLGLRRSPLPVVTATRVVLRVVERLMGAESGSEQVARARLARLAQTGVGRPA